MRHQSSNSVPPELRAVAIGGGTGLATLLRGLKRCLGNPLERGVSHFSAHSFVSSLTAVVAITDDGGSSGRLRRDLDILPPGDLRNCIVALSKNEDLLSRLFAHRFETHGDLHGHSFGNLFIAALAEMSGDFAQAIRIASELLDVQGVILPASSIKAALLARLESGSLIRGESRIRAAREKVVELMLEPSDVPALPEVLEAIARADLITIGPGSLYTSLITNLLIDGIVDAISRSQATRVYIANLMTEANESLGLSVSEHIDRIYQHTGRPIFDYAIVNTGPIPKNVYGRYAAAGARPVLADIERIEAMGIRCLTGDFVDEGGVLRHSPHELAEVLLALAETSVPSERTAMTW